MKTTSTKQIKNARKPGGKFYWKRLFSCFSASNYSMSSYYREPPPLSYYVTQARAHILYLVDDNETVNRPETGPQTLPSPTLLRSTNGSPRGSVSVPTILSVDIDTELVLSGLRIYPTNAGCTADD